MNLAARTLAILAVLSTPSGASAQVLEAFREPVPEFSHQFGVTVAVVEGVLAASANVAFGSGEVHLFETATGDHLLQIDSNRRYFGRALANVGGALAVGSRGAVEIFDVTPGSPTFGALLRTLIPPQSHNDFGAVLAAAGNLLVVNGGGSVAYIYDPSNGAIIHVLGSGVDNDAFGNSIGASPVLVAIGAPGTTVDGAGNAGAAYVFRVDTGQLVFPLLSPDPISGGEFGTSVAVVADSVAVGARQRLFASPPGTVYLFSLVTGFHERTLQSPVASDDDDFGIKIVGDDSQLVITDGRGRERSTVYVYHAPTFSGPQIIQNPDPESFSGSDPTYFGRSTALLGDDVVVGAPRNDYVPPLGGKKSYAGAVYIFEGRPPPTPTPRQTPGAVPTPTPLEKEEIVVIVEQPTCKGVSGTANIQGIVYSTLEGAEIERLVKVIFDEGTSSESELDVPCCSSRGDAPVLLSGFSGVFNWCLLSPGLHTITLAFTSTTGKTLTASSEFISYCAHRQDRFLREGEFDWRTNGSNCDSDDDGGIVCTPAASICAGEMRYEWSQAAQGPVLKSNCEVDGFNPRSPPACGAAVIQEEGSILD